MNPYDFYVTPEEYEEARAYGISMCLVNTRIRKLAWSKKKAITTPPRELKSREKVFNIAKQYGISHKQLLNRLYLGWDEHRASTTPICDAEQRRENALRLCTNNRKYPIEMILSAKENGISYECLLYRLHHGWDIERATTLHPSYSNGAMRIKELYGESYHRNLMRWVFQHYKDKE